MSEIVACPEYLENWKGLLDWLGRGFNSCVLEFGGPESSVQDLARKLDLESLVVSLSALEFPTRDLLTRKNFDSDEKLESVRLDSLRDCLRALKFVETKKSSLKKLILFQQDEDLVFSLHWFHLLDEAHSESIEVLNKLAFEIDFEPQTRIQRSLLPLLKFNNKSFLILRNRTTQLESGVDNFRLFRTNCVKCRGRLRVDDFCLEPLEKFVPESDSEEILKKEKKLVEESIIRERPMPYKNENLQVDGISPNTSSVVLYGKVMHLQKKKDEMEKLEELNRKKIRDLDSEKLDLEEKLNKLEIDLSDCQLQLVRQRKISSRLQEQTDFADIFEIYETEIEKLESDFRVCQILDTDTKLAEELVLCKKKAQDVEKSERNYRIAQRCLDEAVKKVQSLQKVKKNLELQLENLRSDYEILRSSTHDDRADTESLKDEVTSLKKRLKLMQDTQRAFEDREEYRKQTRREDEWIEKLIKGRPRSASSRTEKRRQSTPSPRLSSTERTVVKESPKFRDYVLIRAQKSLDVLEKNCPPSLQQHVNRVRKTLEGRH